MEMTVNPAYVYLLIMGAFSLGFLCASIMHVSHDADDESIGYESDVTHLSDEMQESEKP